MESSPKVVCPRIQCTVQILPLADSTSRKSNGRLLKNAEITLGRNQFRDVVILISSDKNNVISSSVNGIKIHKNFVHEGKATFHLTEAKQSVMISNAPPSLLQLLIKTLAFKVALSQKKTPVAARSRLLATKSCFVEEISPLTSSDIVGVQKSKHGAVTPTRKIRQPLRPVDANRQLPSTSCRFEGPRKRKLEVPSETLSPKSRAKASLSRFLVPHQLTEEQKNVLNLVMSGQSIFFTGCAGTGKSYLLRRIIGSLSPDVTYATASTGVAACHIDGTTLHAFAGIGSGKAPIEQCLELARRPVVAKQWKTVKHLIIDEVSMVDGEFFEKLEEVARKVRDSDLPFGGIQLILCGDFLQLPPVVKRGEKRRYAFQTESWDRCISRVVELLQVHRQADLAFVKILGQIRAGRCSSESYQTLKETVKQKIEKNGVIPTMLCTHTDDVDHINCTNLDKLPGEAVSFRATDSETAYSKQLDQQTPVPSLLSLKPGAQVMLMKNLDVSRGLVNGARGVVAGFEKGSVVVNFACGTKEKIYHERYGVKHGNSLVTRSQIPLRLAWAFSIHKAQGMTLDCVEITLGRAFEVGQVYVALSRAKSLESVRILDFSLQSVKADPVVLAFYREVLPDLY